MRDSIQFNTRVTAAHLDDANQLWDLHTDTGQRQRARHLIMATGTFFEPHRPEFEGVDQFRGQLLQSCRWSGEGVDFKRKRVGIIGTGTTGV